MLEPIPEICKDAFAIWVTKNKDPIIQYLDRFANWFHKLANSLRDYQSKKSMKKKCFRLEEQLKAKDEELKLKNQEYESLQARIELLERPIPLIDSRQFQFDEIPTALSQALEHQYMFQDDLMDRLSKSRETPSNHDHESN